MLRNGRYIKKKEALAASDDYNLSAVGLLTAYLFCLDKCFFNCILSWWDLVHHNVTCHVAVVISGKKYKKL